MLSLGFGLVFFGCSYMTCFVPFSLLYETIAHCIRLLLLVFKHHLLHVVLRRRDRQALYLYKFFQYSTMIIITAILRTFMYVRQDTILGSVYSDEDASRVVKLFL